MKKFIILLTLSTLFATHLYSQTEDPLKGQLFVLDTITEYELIVKFKSELEPVTDNGNVTFLTHSPSKKVTTDISKLAFHPVLSFTDEQKEIAKNSTQRKLKNSNGFNILDYTGLCTVVGEETSKEYLLKLGSELESLDEVEYCSLEPKTAPAPPGFFKAGTPNLVKKQNYRSANPGIDIDYAFSIGAKGKNVQIADVEYSWGDLSHEEFKGQDIAYGSKHNADSYKDHGIAVMGILSASVKNKIGIKGSVPKAVARVFSEAQGRAAAILNATQNSKPGDIILLEMQAFGPDGNYGPADIYQSVWDAVKAATDAGVIIIAAAGNGNANLDAEHYSDYKNRGDNGSILVGAGSSDINHNKLGFSTYGERVNLQGWGENVYTTGFGDVKFDNDPNKAYTASFNGTSSATPIVSSAAACIQSYAKKKLKKTLSPIEMRDLLISTGIPQGDGGHIGPLPNIKAAIEKLLNGTETDDIKEEVEETKTCQQNDETIVVFTNDTECELTYTYNSSIETIAAKSSKEINTSIGSEWIVEQNTENTINQYTVTCDQQEYITTGECEVISISPCEGLKKWKKTKEYQVGNKVKFKGNIFKWNGSEWETIGTCDEGIVSKHASTPPVSSHYSVSLYPNPAADSFVIKTKQANLSKRNIYISDVNGKVINDLDIQKTNSINGHVAFRIDATTLSKGVYFIQLNTAKHNTVKKLMIQ